MVEKAWVGAKIDHRGRLEPSLVAQVKLVLARRIGKISNGFSVRAPGWIALRHARRLRQVARFAFFGGNREDLPMGLKHRARAGGRQSGVLNLFRVQFHAARRQVGQLPVNLDGHNLVRLCGGIEQVNRAKLFVNQPSGAGLERLQVEACIGRRLAHLLAGDIVAVKRNRSAVLSRAIAVRQKVDRITHPYRVRIVRVVAGHLHHVQRLQIHNPYRRGISAHVALPGRLNAPNRHIRQRRSVRRKRALRAGWKRQRLGNAGTVGMHAEQPEVVPVAGLTARHQHILAVCRPPRHKAARRVPGEPPRHPARGCNHVCVVVPIQVGRVCNPISVRRVVRSRNYLPVRREPLGYASFAAHRPNVIRIPEGDPVLAERGAAQKKGRLCGGRLGQGEGGEQQRKNKQEAAADHVHLRRGI